MQVQQKGRDLLNQIGQLGIKFDDLLVQPLTAAGERLQRGQHGARFRIGMHAGTAGGQRGDQPTGGQVAVLLPDRDRRGDQLVADLHLGCRPGLDRGPAGIVQRPQRGDVSGLGCRSRTTRQHRERGLIGIQRIRLALTPTHGAFRAEDLEHLQTRLDCCPRDPGAIGTGALDPDTGHLAVASEEVQRMLVASRRGRELLIRQLATPGIDRRDMNGVGMGIDAADHRARIQRCHCHDGYCLPVASDGRRRSGKQTGH